jgi:uncharacterized protein
MAAPVDALIDTGPLVGFLDKSDQWHGFAVETFPCVNFPAYTCEAVISEAIYHLRESATARNGLLEMIDIEALVVLPVFPESRAYLRQTLKKYGPKTDLADAGLLWLAETHPGLSILTTDKRDFSRYRLHAATRILKIIAP